jgi:hypothetical protein
MWEKCGARYGGGTGYRVDVSSIFQDQFENDAAAMTAAQKTEAQVAAVWEQIVIDPLRESSAFVNEE